MNDSEPLWGAEIKITPDIFLESEGRENKTSYSSWLGPSIRHTHWEFKILPNS